IVLTLRLTTYHDSSHLPSCSSCILLFISFFFFLLLARPPSSTLFPYTTLFRSVRPGGILGIEAQVAGPELEGAVGHPRLPAGVAGRKSTRLNSSHGSDSDAGLRVEKKNGRRRGHARRGSSLLRRFRPSAPSRPW